MKVKQIVENAGETTINTNIKRQLKEQLGPRKKTFLFTLLESIPNFPALDFFPMFLFIKPKKRKKKKKKDRKSLALKMQKKPASAKPKYNCRCSNNVKKQ